MQKIFFLFSLAFFLHVHSALGQPPTRSLVAHFDFEDTLNKSLIDVSGNGSSGIFLGDPVGQGCGISGKSVRLDGVTNRIIFFGGINDQFKGGDFTLSLYFKPAIASTTQTQALLCKGELCEAEKFFGVKVGVFQRNILLDIRENKLTKKTNLKGLYSKACWHHLVIVKARKDITMYLDGKKASTIPINEPYNLTSNAPLTIAEHQCLGNDLVRFKGELDEMYMYSRTLSTAEIQQLYQPVDKILTRDTLVYLGNSSFQAFTTQTCANRFQWFPDSTVSDPFIRTPIITPTKSTYYALKFIDDASGCSTTDSVFVKVVDPAEVGCGEIFLPKAFTPNGDNLNEEFAISNPYAIENLISFEVYNRWGSRVFATNDKFKGWNGEVSSKISTTDTFIYKIEYECAGNRQVVSNTFTLLR